LLNCNLKPKISTSFEADLDWRFFNNRLGFDFTYYNINTKNQILPSVPVSITSGNWNRVVNAGKINNYGYELMLTGRPIDGKNLKWDVIVNWSGNRSKVVEFYGEITTLSNGWPTRHSPKRHGG
jgi:outer membrane receptor protein involved in Fe transport